MNITKHDLCLRVARKFEKVESGIKSAAPEIEAALVHPHIPPSVSELREIFDIFIDEIMATVAEGARIEIRGFGCFKPVLKKKRIGRNPRTGQVVDIPPYEAPYFKFSRDAQRIFEEKKSKQT